MSIEDKYLLKIKSAFLQAVNAGKPEIVFSEKIKNYFPKSKEIKVLAVGKAASSMVEQIIKLKIANTGVLVTNAENFRYIKGFECFSTGHPLPDKKGLNASNKVELFLDNLPSKLSNKVVSAEELAIRWIETRTEKEMMIYDQLVEITHGIINEAFSTNVITLGQWR